MDDITFRNTTQIVTNDPMTMYKHCIKTNHIQDIYFKVFITISKYQSERQGTE